MSDELLTLQQAANHRGVSLKTIRRYIEAGTLPAFPLGKGRALGVRAADVDALKPPATAVRVVLPITEEDIRAFLRRAGQPATQRNLNLVKHCLRAAATDAARAALDRLSWDTVLTSAGE